MQKLKFWTSSIALIAIILLIGCDDNPTRVTDEIWFSLDADTLSGTAPLTVHFIGTLHGNIQGVVMRSHVPMLCIAYQDPCNPSCACPGFARARRTYEREQAFDEAGSYWICMLLLRMDGTEPEVISSDTLLVNVYE